MTDFDYSNMTPENVLKAANQAAEAIRYLNHATLSPVTAALRYPGDVDAVLVALEELGQRLPQLLDQLGAWMVAECKADRVRVVVPGAHSPSTEAVAVAALRQYLDEAGVGAEAFRRAIHDGRQITATLAQTRPTLRASEPQEGE